MTTGHNLHVLLVTPTGRDAELIGQVLETFDIQSETLSDLATCRADVISASWTKPQILSRVGCP